ncbi:MAG: S8 family serine peptidase [Bacteroidota bacterium]
MKKTKRLLLKVILLIFISLPTFAQRLDHVQGEILIKLKKGADPETVVARHQSLRSSPTNLKVDRKISTPMDIYALTFDWEQVDEQQMLAAMWRSPLVEIAQFNHLVELRSTIPDDTQFDDQWQYINTGQSGGTPGADIDMDLAWDVTTGGLTPEGDTIVVCIIDGGYQITHPDLAENVWFNYAEIPNNGIDDDNNGFVDDFRGWDTGSNDDNITNNAWHGTPVAGIVGAKGNNGIGVAGINWDVKLMLVAGGTGVESEVLEAYSYPLTARIRYNETNGAEGAFVVATNASWGVDGGQPADAPLWCAFYDTLGVYGILNAGATINGNQNVDVFGDLPTGCSSDYLITVTNMNDDDEKVTGAGYGLETIDLGAFGAGTWNIANNNGYDGFGGTSGATPHVTGTIGLLYSAPCSNLTALAKADPGAAALMVRQYILEGVDPNASLDNITVTGGRLNVNNSVQLLMANCGPCPAPAGLGVSDLTDTKVNLIWTNNDSARVDTLRWRPVGAPDWVVVDSASSPYPIDILLACTDYEFQVISSCDTIASDYSAVFAFKTEGCCDAPAGFGISDITETTASASWGNVLASQSYDVYIRPVDSMDWVIENTSGNNFEFMNLMPCTNYEVRVQTVCPDSLGKVTEDIQFKTKGCGACLDLVYCEAPALSTADEWIQSVAIDTLENISGDNSGYGDFTGGDSIVLATNNSVGITLTPGYSGFQFGEVFRVWIDFNQNGEFGDPGEEVYTSPQTQSAVSGTISIPGSAALGLTRMRVSMYFDDVPTPCNGPSQNFGEIEDYCVIIVEGVAPCDIPANLDTFSVGEVVATIQWDAMIGADEYNVRYKEVNAVDWIERTATNNSYTLDSLEGCFTYEVQVRSVCDSTFSGFSDRLEFTTDCINSTNNLQEDIAAMQIFPNPFKEQITVGFSFNTAKEGVRISLINQLGQTIQSRNISGVTNEIQRVVFDGEQISAGVYLIKIQTADGKQLAQKVAKL